MKSSCWLVLVSLGWMLAGNATGEQKLQHVETLPELSLSQPRAAQRIWEDRKVNLALTLRTQETMRDKSASTHVGYWFYAKKGRSLNITAKLNRGIPMFMLCDGPMPPVLTTALSTSNGPEELGVPLPCNPIAYNVGAVRDTGSITIVPRYDAIWQVHVWALHKPIVVPAPFEVSDEMKQALIQQGYSEEQIPLLWSELDLNLAWSVTDENNANQQGRDQVDLELLLRSVDGEGDRVPTQVLLDQMRAITPKHASSPLVLSETYFASVEKLKQLTGKVEVALPQSRRLPTSTYRHFPLLDPLLPIVGLKDNPIIAGAIRRQYEKKKAWAPRLREAMATIRLAKGKLAEVEVLDNRTSHELARNLNIVKGVEAVLVDSDGVVLAATRQWVYPTIHKQAAWQTLTDADGSAILVAPAYREAPYEFKVRKLAVPVMVDGLSEPIGWILLKVMDDPRFAQ